MGLFSTPKRPYDITTRKTKDIPRDEVQKNMSESEKKAWNELHREIHRQADPTWTSDGKITGIFSSITDPENRSYLYVSLAVIIGAMIWRTQ